MPTLTGSQTSEFLLGADDAEQGKPIKLGVRLTLPEEMGGRVGVKFECGADLPFEFEDAIYAGAKAGTLSALEAGGGVPPEGVTVRVSLGLPDDMDEGLLDDLPGFVEFVTRNCVASIMEFHRKRSREARKKRRPGRR
ncbi:MAG: hypothetical protein KIT58_04150 [Planctomycetota bacterium]|nr:hypothetical protein [Planctomycetota bacterium]